MRSGNLAVDRAEARTLSRNLTVHFQRATYLVEPGPDTSPLGGKRVLAYEWEDGRGDRAVC